MKLNRQQELAVRHVDGPILVLAGAGSGKTRVIVKRIANLITDAGIYPWHILAITFTNKAANEMKTRLETMLQESDSRKITVGTFHSVCTRILRFEHNALKLSRNFSIADEANQLTRIKRALKETGANPDILTPKLLISKISRAKNQFETPETWQNKSGYNPFNKTFAEIFQLYQQGLKADQSLDFDDLITETVRLFQNEPHILSKYQDKYRYILIDEYQDTNNAQYMFVKLLSGRYRNVMAVGDDDQSIYQWRGAEISNIINFHKDFPGAKTIKLEQNYRSTQIILTAASALMRHNKKRNPKTLWTDIQGGELIHLETWLNDKEEARAICRNITNKVNSGFRKYSDYAVLYRVNAQSRVLEEAFQSQKIPYRVVGNTSFFKRKEVKDLLAYIRLVLNTGDSVSCRRILNVPRRGIGKTTLNDLEEVAVRNGTDLFSSIGLLLQTNQLNSRKHQSLEAFVSLINALKKIDQENNAEDVVRHLLQMTGYRESFVIHASAEAKASIEIIDEFVNTVADYVVHGDGSLSGFADYLSLYSDDEDGDLGADTNQVQLMTLHNAKGLEFTGVFIAGLEEELCPLIRNNKESLSAELLEEERRLLYVGMTRARQELHLYNAERRFLYGREMVRQPSRFLYEIPSESLKQVDHARDMMQKTKSNPAAARKSFNSGDRVLHATWGTGTVVDCSGDGPTAKVVINFDRGLKKKLLAGPANLVHLNRNISRIKT